jgi:hypothetical protein
VFDQTCFFRHIKLPTQVVGESERCAKEKPLQLEVATAFGKKTMLRILRAGDLARAWSKAIPGVIAQVRVNRRAANYQGVRVPRISRRNVADRAFVFGFCDRRIRHPNSERNADCGENNKSGTSNATKTLFSNQEQFHNTPLLIDSRLSYQPAASVNRNSAIW